MGTNIYFPDFCKAWRISDVTMRLFDSPKSQYDVIIGCDILPYGFVFDHAHNIITWDGLTIEMATSKSTNSTSTTCFSCDLSAAQVYANSTTKIMHAKYEKSSPTDVVKSCTHLQSHEQQKLFQLLSKFTTLFSGSLWRYVHRKFSIQLKDPNATPIFCNPYPIPLVHQEVFKAELQHLVDEKVLQRISRSEWAFPTFLIPKKDGRVRWISDFRHLNKLLRRPRYFLSIIPAIMQKRAGFSYITKLDISMGFIPLSWISKLNNIVLSVHHSAFISTSASLWVSPIALMSSSL